VATLLEQRLVCLDDTKPFIVEIVYVPATDMHVLTLCERELVLLHVAAKGWIGV